MFRKSWRSWSSVQRRQPQPPLMLDWRDGHTRYAPRLTTLLRTTTRRLAASSAGAGAAGVLAGRGTSIGDTARHRAYRDTLGCRGWHAIIAGRHNDRDGRHDDHRGLASTTICDWQTGRFLRRSVTSAPVRVDRRISSRPGATSESTMFAGFDYGTSNCSIGWVRDGVVRLVPLEDGDPLIPSTLYAPRPQLQLERSIADIRGLDVRTRSFDELRFGRAALAAYLEAPSAGLFRQEPEELPRRQGAQRRDQVALRRCRHRDDGKRQTPRGAHDRRTDLDRS